MLEAAACGVPIVSTKVGEIPLLWENEKEILLVNCFSPIEFADKISAVFDSVELAEQLSANARKKAENFDWEVLREKWISLF